jgi:predicted metal-binding protein
VPNHVLFVCKSCNSVHSDDVDYEKSDGANLLNRLLSLHQNWTHQDELEIRAVGCLWTCDRPCAVAFSAPNKATYLFTKVPSDTAEALLQFSEVYLNSKAGDIPWKQFPEVLQSAEVAKVPSLHEGDSVTE